MNKISKKLLNAKALPVEKVLHKDAREILNHLKQRNGSNTTHSKSYSKPLS